MTSLQPRGPQEAQRADRQIVARSMHPMDALLHQEERLFDLPEAASRVLTGDLVSAAFALHYRACERYRAYCERVGVWPSQIQGYEDLGRIPLLPTSIFKRHRLTSCAASDVERHCLSSGTQGTQSVVLRDGVTLERLLATVRSLLQIAPPIRESAAQLFVLSPDTEEAADLWLAYILSVTEILFPATFYVRAGELELDALVRDLARLPSHRQPVIVAPPATLLRVMDHIEAQGRSFDLGAAFGVVITAGGWKRAQGSAVDPSALRSRAQRVLGLRSPDHLRDSFNMVEMNTVMLACEQGHFHTPPTLYMRAIDPRSMATLDPGVEGILAFADASSTSYPAFVMTDDYGVVGDFASCGCGRSAPWFRHTRRLRTVEARGCARKVDRMQGGAR